MRHGGGSGSSTTGRGEKVRPCRQLGHSNGRGMGATRVAGAALLLAAVFLFLNYKLMLVKTPLRTVASDGQSGEPSRPAWTGRDMPRGPPAEETDDQSFRIRQLEDEVALLRSQLLRSTARRPAKNPEPSMPAVSTQPSVSATSTDGGSPPVSPLAFREKPCPGGCGTNGTCNRALGECMCAPHLRGPGCAEPMFPACSFMWGFSLVNAPCGLPEATFPITCECAEQCDDENVLMRRMCFEHRPPHDVQRQRVKRWFTGSTEERWLMTVVDSPSMLELINDYAEQSRARRVCNGNGIFMPKLPRWLDPPGIATAIPPDHFNPQGAAVCACLPTFWGEDCQHRIRGFSTCLNDCSGRGRCVGSVCVCTDGFWGVDCSMRVREGGVSVLADQAHSIANSEDGSAKVYVYEMPGAQTTWLAAHMNAHEWTHFWWFYDNDVSLHQRFLASPYRTTNPAEADFFYIPLYRSMGAYTAGWGPGVVTPKGWRAFQAAVSHVNRSYPFFSRSGGKDHCAPPRPDANSAL